MKDTETKKVQIIPEGFNSSNSAKYKKNNSLGYSVQLTIGNH